MRFLIGIIIGTALTLLVATAVDAPTNPIVSALTDAWHKVIRVTGDTLFRAPAEPASTTADTSPNGPPGEPLNPPANPVERPSPFRAPPADVESTPAEPAALDPEFNPADLVLDINTPATPPAPDSPHSAPVGTALSGLPTALSGLPTALSGLPTALSGLPTALSDLPTALSDLPTALSDLTTTLSDPIESLSSTTSTALTSESPVEDAAAPSPDFDALQTLLEDNAVSQFDGAATLPPDTALTEDVWTPFHSERSARGFARRLTEQTAYPFDVVRQGPGAYQVVFAYDSATQREVLLQQIATLTGR